MSRVPKSSLVVHGQCLCHASEYYSAGNGTYQQGDYIHSSLTGYVDFNEVDKETVVEVSKGFERNIIPSAGAIVTVKITNIRRRYVKCSIYCVGDHVLREPFRGIIRKEDVRMKDRDRVELYKCFRPGDIVLAKVASMGSMHSFNLTTAEDELGVVLAMSEAGSEMVPTSWSEMMCTKTYVKEPRKVAKVVPQNFTSKNFMKLQKEFEKQ